MSLDEGCAIRSTKCANGGVDRNGTKAWNLTDAAPEVAHEAAFDAMSAATASARAVNAEMAFDMRAGYTRFMTSESPFLPCDCD